MADIELIIKISEDSHRATCNGCMLPPDVENVVQGIKNGTPLPKGHGRLIDADELCKGLMKRWSTANERLETLISEVMSDVVTPIVAITPTIVESDKENKE